MLKRALRWLAIGLGGLAALLALAAGAVYAVSAYRVFGQLPLYVAETMDHAAPRIEAPSAGATKEYGRYLAVTGGCTGCHGPTLSGGPVIGGPPGAPPALNLTPGGELVGWTEADFFRALREGKTPGGRQLDEFMPWKATREMADDEIRALLLYLCSIPAKPYGNH
jgi:mono/diheme cytochrome c family protein